MHRPTLHGGGGWNLLEHLHPSIDQIQMDGSLSTIPIFHGELIGQTGNFASIIKSSVGQVSYSEGPWLSQVLEFCSAE
jgi:hypothetical protein